MRIGLDLDNTLIGYESAFAIVAAEMGLLPPGWHGGKEAVRAELRCRDGGEIQWQRLQGQVYGPRIALAEPLPGSEAFILGARRLGHALVIVSHKTRTGHFDASGTDLHQAARGWLERQGYFDRFGFAAAEVWFEETRAAKLARIAALHLDVFIDDLPEVLADPGFPPFTRPVLLTDWGDVTRQVLS
jgi:hypothetical protein